MRFFPRLANESDAAPKLAEMTEQTGSMFIPAEKAAICADSECGGVFQYTAGACPGCGSKQWVLLQPAAWFKKAMQDAQRRAR